MSIPQDQVPITSRTGTGTAKQFSYEFYAPDVRDVFVEIGGTLVDESEWKAVKDSDSTGRIIFNTAPAAGAAIKIYRSTPITQTTVWQEGQAFYAGTIQSAADKITMIAQELRGGTVNVPGTVVTAHSATYATNAGSAGSAGSAAIAGSATRATNALSAGFAPYNGPFEVLQDYESGGYAYYAVRGGVVCANGSKYTVPDGEASALEGNAAFYLVGSSAIGDDPTFSFTTDEPTSAASRFYAPLAEFTGGKMHQLQFGNIVDTSWGTGGGGTVPTTVSSALSAGIASGLTEDAENSVMSSVAAGAWYEGPFAVNVTDTTSNGTCTVNVASGRVVVGPSRHLVPSSESISISSGGHLYLVGSSGGGNVTFNYASSVPASAANQFCTKIADNRGGTMKQVQFGEITTMPWNTGSGGAMRFPDYGELDASSKASLQLDSTYKTADDGFLRVSLKNASGTDGCLRLTIGSSTIGLMDVKPGGPGFTVPALPLSSGTEFSVSLISATASVFIAFDRNVTSNGAIVNTSLN